MLSSYRTKCEVIGVGCTIGLLFLIVYLLWRPLPASGKGGVYESTKHGHLSVGVDRIPGEPKGDCVHCHDEHASRDGIPTPGGPYDYLLFKVNDNDLCYTCHTLQGAQEIYQGRISYENSHHGNVAEADGFNPASDKRLPSCQACHNPHGVEAGGTGQPFASLLVKWVYGLGANSSDEEFLCYGGSSGGGYCHSNNSPYASEIEAAFEGTATANPDSKSINTHHDISYNDQQTSGAKIECVDCHNVHDTNFPGSNPEDIVIADPDTGDGKIPTAGSMWPASNFLSEWCLDCHDNSFPSTVTPPTVAITDVYSTWASDVHGIGASKNPTLRAGSGYAQGDTLQCSDCHVGVAHGYYDLVPNGYDQSNQNLFQLKSTIYSKDGATPLESDEGPGITLVRVTDITSGPGGNTDPSTNAKYWCSTCHPGTMTGKSRDCLSSECHVHGVGKDF